MRRLAWAMLVAGLALLPRPAFAVEISARFAADQVEVGGTVALEVRVAGASGAVGQPELTLPDGLQLLGTSQSQNFQWINGRSSSSIVYRLEIEAVDAGRYVVGPVRIAIGGQTYVSDAMTLRVTNPGGSGGTGPASLSLTLDPPSPYAGQLCRLVVRLVQRVTLAEDSEYDPPALPGFWTESWSEPGGYQGREGSRTVQVIERALRLYPLAAGDGTIGRARASVTPAIGAVDPVFGGLLRSGRRVPIASAEIPVHVRPLPGGAPAGFDGAVGDFEVAWRCDRSHTAEDQPVTVTLDVRGIGNLPLIRPPTLAGPGFEVFASTSDDSLPPPGVLAPGRKRFQWTVLPRGGREIRIPAPAFAWFDPGAARYRTADAPPVELTVESAGLAGSDAGRGFPALLASHPPAPARHGAQPWAMGLAGLAAAGVAEALRRRRQPAADAPERARQREWVRAVTRTTGPDFWRAADEAVGWSESRGLRVMRLREEIAAARFGGTALPEQDVRRRVLERLKEALPEEADGTGSAWIGIALGLGAVALVAFVLGLGTLPDARWRARVVTADRDARAGRIEAATAEWRALWRETHHPDVAARLAWSALGEGRTADAAAWVVAARARTARRASVTWAAARVREAGGLTGMRERVLPVTRLEWGLLAFAALLAAGMVWERRRAAYGLAVVGLLCVLAPTLEAWRLAWPPQRVVRDEANLADGSLTLDPGQVVDLVRIQDGMARIRATAGSEGEVPAGVLLVPGETP